VAPGAPLDEVHAFEHEEPVADRRDERRAVGDCSADDVDDDEVVRKEVVDAIGVPGNKSIEVLVLSLLRLSPGDRAALWSSRSPSRLSGWGRDSAWAADPAPGSAIQAWG
jgi:hypothetical protein